MNCNESESPVHNTLQILTGLLSIRGDLPDIPLSTEIILFTDFKLFQEVVLNCCFFFSYTSENDPSTCVYFPFIYFLLFVNLVSASFSAQLKSIITNLQNNEAIIKAE